MDWKLRIIPAPTMTIPMSGTIQWMSSRAVQPVMRRPTGSKNVPGTIEAAYMRVQRQYHAYGGKYSRSRYSGLPTPPFLAQKCL